MKTLNSECENGTKQHRLAIRNACVLAMLKVLGAVRLADPTQCNELAGHLVI